MSLSTTFLGKNRCYSWEGLHICEQRVYVFVHYPGDACLRARDFRCLSINVRIKSQRFKKVLLIIKTVNTKEMED